jgi:altronate dehydratase
MGAIGAVGSATGVYTTGTGTGAGLTWQTTTPSINNNIKITGHRPMLSTDKHEIDLDELAETITIVRERLLILIPDFEKHEKYAALKKAYEHYKLLEAMIAGESK